MQEFAEYLSLLILLAGCAVVAVNWTYVRRRVNDVQIRVRGRHLRG